MSAFESNCTIKIFRAKTMQQMLGGTNGVPGFVIPYISGRLMRPEEMLYDVTEVSKDADATTHIISFDYVPQTVYQPFLEDYVLVANSGNMDGYYVMKQYPRPYTQGDPDDDHFECLSRYLGPKKPGDTRTDNSSNIRLGGHKVGSSGG